VRYYGAWTEGLSSGLMEALDTKYYEQPQLRMGFNPALLGLAMAGASLGYESDASEDEAPDAGPTRSRVPTLGTASLFSFQVALAERQKLHSLGN
jgi:hypothetical protein